MTNSTATTPVTVVNVALNRELGATGSSTYLYTFTMPKFANATNTQVLARAPNGLPMCAPACSFSAPGRPSSGTRAVARACAALTILSDAAPFAR